MQEAFEKIIERLEERKQLHNRRIDYERKNGTVTEEFQARKAVEVVDDAIEIVKQEAEKFGTDINVGSNGWIPCSVVDHPEHCNDCEVTMLDTHGYTRDIAFYTDKWRRSSDEAAVTVIAWKEPSQPYQPKGE